MAQGTLREDFYYRIHVFAIHLPPLRERREDLPLLVNQFMKENTKIFNRDVHEIAQDALRRLQEYSWPGNVRELKNAIDHAFVTVNGSCVTLFDLPPEVQRSTSAIQTTQTSLASLNHSEETRIREAMRLTKGNKTEAA